MSNFKKYISEMGFSDNSPFKGEPYIDINTPTGKIDMSNTGTPLFANGRLLAPYSGIHDLGTTTVREVPLRETFNWRPEQKRNFYSFLFPERNEGNYIGGMGYNFPSGTQLNAAGVLPISPNPIFKGAIDMGIKQNFGNTDIGLNFSSPILNDPYEYFVNQNIQKQPLNFLPKLSLTHRFRDGGQPLPKAQEGIGDYWQDFLTSLNPYNYQPEGDYFFDQKIPTYYGTKGDAFRQAHRELGPGKYFLHDGTRYSTDLKGETTHGPTKAIHTRFESAVIDGKIDQTVYDRYLEVWNQLGQPEINIGRDDDKNFMASHSWDDLGLDYQDHVNPLTGGGSGVMWIKDDYTTGDPVRLMKAIINEFPHVQQTRQQGRLDYTTDYVWDLISVLGDQGALYSKEGTIEEEAHGHMKSELMDYIYKGPSEEDEESSDLNMVDLIESSKNVAKTFGIPQYGDPDYINPFPADNTGTIGFGFEQGGELPIYQRKGGFGVITTPTEEESSFDYTDLYKRGISGYVKADPSTLREGSRLNYDEDGNVTGSSTVIMKAELLSDGTWVSFPSLFQNEDGEWYDTEEEMKKWKGENEDMHNLKWEDSPVFKEALIRGEVYNWGSDKESALAHAEGSWKTPKSNTQSYFEEYKDGGQPLPQAQFGLGTLGMIINPLTIGGGGKLAIDYIKNKMADNIDPWGYGGHEEGETTFDRVYNSIFTTENKEHESYGTEDVEGERRDLLHMLLGLEQENNSIKKQTQYVPTKGHNEGDLYYTSPHTEMEIQQELNKVGKTTKDIFYEEYSDSDNIDKDWEEYINEEIEYGIFTDIYYDQEIREYDGKEIEYYKSEVEDDPDNLIYYKDIPQYNKFKESNDFKSMSKDIINDAENYMEYPDIETFLTTPGNKEEGIEQSGGFYGSVLGNFTLNQGEDEQGKYFSYYDKWDLDPFGFEGGWKKDLTDFAQEHILNVKPASLYNRMYYTQDDQGNYTFKKGGELPKAQSLGEFNIGNPNITDQTTGTNYEFSIHRPIIDSNGKCWANCGQRYYMPKWNWQLGTSMEGKVSPQDELAAMEARMWSGLTLNADQSGKTQAGLKAYLGANAGIKGLYDNTLQDYNIHPTANIVGNIGFEGDAEDASSYATYLAGRRGDPLKWGYGLTGNYDILNQDFDLGAYLNFANWGINAGYDFQNQTPSFGINYGLPLKKQGGSLSKAQEGIETTIYDNPYQHTTQKDLNTEDALDWSDQEALAFYYANQSHPTYKDMWNPTPHRIRKEVQLQNNDWLYRNATKPFTSFINWLAGGVVPSSPEQLVTNVVLGLGVGKLISKFKGRTTYPKSTVTPNKIMPYTSNTVPTASGVFIDDVIANSRYMANSQFNKYRMFNNTGTQLSPLQQNLLNNEQNILNSIANKGDDAVMSLYRYGPESGGFYPNSPGYYSSNPMTPMFYQNARNSGYNVYKIDIPTKDLSKYYANTNKISAVDDPMGLYNPKGIKTQYNEFLLPTDINSKATQLSYDDYLKMLGEMKLGGQLPKAQTNVSDATLNQDIIEKEMGVGEYANRDDISFNRFMPKFSKEMIFNKFRPGRYPIMSEVWKDFIGKTSDSFPNTDLGISNKQPWLDQEGHYTADEEAWRMVLGLTPQESGENKYLQPSTYLPSGDEYNKDLDYYKFAPGQMDWQNMLNSINQRNAQLYVAQGTGNYEDFQVDWDTPLTEKEIADLQRWGPGSHNIAIPSSSDADLGGVEHMYNYLINPHGASGPTEGSTSSVYDPIARFDMDLDVDEEGKHYISYRDVYNFNSPMMNAAIKPFGWYDRQYVDYDEATGIYTLPEGTDITGMSENRFNLSKADLDSFINRNKPEEEVTSEKSNLPLKLKRGGSTYWNKHGRNLYEAQDGDEFTIGVSKPGYLEYLRKNFAKNIMPFDYDNGFDRIWETAFNNQIEDKRANLDYELEANPNIKTGMYPAYRERIDLLNMYMGQDQVWNSVNESQYRPTEGAKPETIFYKSEYTEDEIRNRLPQIFEWLELGLDINDFARDLDERPEKVKCKEGEKGCVKTKDGWIWDTYEKKNPALGRGLYGDVLGNFKLDKGEDEHGHYFSYYDKWNLNPTGVKLGNQIIDYFGGLQPPQVYGRIYYDPKTKKVIPGPKKKLGGEFLKKIQRLNQQLGVYNQGGKISPLAKRELETLNMIKQDESKGFKFALMQKGGESPIEHHSYVVQKGDNLTRIARDNNMSLSDLLTLNPKYADNPSKVYSGDRIAITENATPDDNKANLTYNIKRGDTLADIANKYGVRYIDIARINNISDPDKIQPGQQIILPDNANTNDPIINKNINIAESVYTDVSSASVNSNPNVNTPWLKRTFEDGKWKNSGKRTIKTGINKMDQADRVIQGMNDIEGDQSNIINYEVKSGDALSMIAQENGVTVTQLMNDNNISDPSQIQAGQKIKINKSTGKPYIIVDEKKGRMHLYYPGQDKPTKSYPILTGTNEGDAQTVTKIGIFKDGAKLDQNQLNQAMKDNNVNTIDDLMEIEGYDSETDWQAGNKQTGAGIYTIGIANEDSGYYDETGQDRKTPSFVLNNSSGSEVPMVIHTVPSWKDKDRINSLTDDDAGNNRMTNGCINGTCDALIDLYDNPDIGEGTMVYVLPEDAGNNFVYENGVINFYANRENQEEYKTYIDERGEEQTGHGIANKTTSNYKPINITFDKNHYQTNSVRYDGTASGEEEEFINNTQPFLNAIADNKKFMMDKLGMDGDMYNDLSMISFGIYGYESGMGDEGSGAENFLKAGLKYTNLQDTSPDVKSKYNTYMQNAENNSVGWTQIRWNQLDQSEKDALAKINITSNEQLMDPANAANATTAILYKRYQNQISTADKNSEDFDIFTALPAKWNKGEGYSDIVNKYMDYIDITETDIDDIDNNLIIKGEYSDDNVESNKRMSNKPIEEKLLNPGETITHMYNQSEYVKPTVDAVIGGVEDAGEWVGDRVDDVSEWWDEVDLNPFWKSGGEFSVGNQVQFYNDFINGNYKGTKQEKKANKMYDKLNRMYYKDSKKTGKHQLDIMKSILGANRRLNN